MPIIIYCDGGCSNNQDPSKRKAYGSYIVIKNDKELKHEYLTFKNETNNEAEYLALSVAISYLETMVIAENIVIRTDSQLIVGHLMQNWKIGSNLCNIVKSVKNRLEMIAPWRVEKISGVEMKQIIGH